jgi:metal-sulfur cluster biosynthetic enzyme
MAMVSEDTVYQALGNVVEPGLAETVLDLGLIYRVRLQSHGRVRVEMTLPTPLYPHSAEIVLHVQQAVQALPEVAQVEVRLVWDPPWTPYRLAGPLKAALGLSEQEPTDRIQPPGQTDTARRGRLGRLFGR